MRLLLPAAIEKNTVTKDIEWNIPSVQVTDEPRFGYRGLMLDVARLLSAQRECIAYHRLHGYVENQYASLSLG